MGRELDLWSDSPVCSPRTQKASSSESARRQGVHVSIEEGVPVCREAGRKAQGAQLCAVGKLPAEDSKLKMRSEARSDHSAYAAIRLRPEFSVPLSILSIFFGGLPRLQSD